MDKMSYSFELEYKSIYYYSLCKGILNSRDAKLAAYLSKKYPEHCRELEDIVQKEQ